jgi:hypothetical protein
MKRSLISVTVIDLLFALSSVTFGQSTPVKKKGKAKVTKPTNGLGGEDDFEVKETAVKQTNNLGGEDDVARTQRSSKNSKSKQKNIVFDAGDGVRDVGDDANKKTSKPNSTGQAQNTNDSARSRKKPTTKKTTTPPKKP